MKTQLPPGASRRQLMRVLAVSGTLACVGCTGHIPDSSLREMLKLHTGSFEELRRMFMIDKTLITISKTTVVGLTKTVRMNGMIIDVAQIGLAPDRYRNIWNCSTYLGSRAELPAT